MNTYNIDKMYENYSGEIERMKKCIDELQQENEQLKADYGNKAQVERDLLQQENQKLKEVIDKAINDIDLVIELIKQQPTEDDSWILDRLNAFKIILRGGINESRLCS